MGISLDFHPFPLDTVKLHICLLFCILMFSPHNSIAWRCFHNGTQKGLIFFLLHSIPLHTYYTLFNQPLLVDIWFVSLFFLLHMTFP